jgi:hypothetical protein
MAKTKLIGEIQLHAGNVSLHLKTARQKFLEGDSEAGWKGISDARTAQLKMDTAISALNAHMKEWDGSFKLKNIFKDKEKLAQKRESAKLVAAKLKSNATKLQEKMNKVLELVKKLPKN